MPTTPEHDARLILSKTLRANDSSSYNKKHKAASDRLIAQFVTLAKADGFAANKTQDGHDVVGGGMRGVIIMVDGDGAIYLAFSSHVLRPANGAPNVHMQLEYDPIDDVLVSTEPDPNVVPIPGDPRPTVHPLVLLARHSMEVMASGT